MKRRYSRGAGARRHAVLAAVLLSLLSACGNDSSDGGTPAQAASNATFAAPLQTAAFFDDIFLAAKGAGYYAFDANTAQDQITGAGRTRYYVNSDNDNHFSRASEVVSGAFVQQSVKRVYITSEAVAISRQTRYTDIGANSKIFAKLPQGYELGLDGISTPLYSVQMEVLDVSGLPVSEVVGQDEASERNGLLVLLGKDSTLMPKGAKIYLESCTVMTTHLRVNLSAAMTGLQSVEAIQAAKDGTIDSLGGYRYLQSIAGAVYIDYDGAIYSGELLSAGDSCEGDVAAYNRIAADFLARREAAAFGLQRAQAITPVS